MLRSVLSVVSGSALWTVLWLSSLAVVNARFGGRFHDDGSLDDPPLLFLLVSLSLLFSLLAGWVTAWLAKRHEIRHGVALGVLQLVLGVFFQAQSWALVPLWYHLIFLALLAPASIAGAWLRVLQGRDIQPVD